MMIGKRHLIVVAPHPDDETFAVGGTIHDHLSIGGTSEVVAVTAGESADDRSTPASRRRMAARRRAERASAMVALGAEGIKITELDFPDRDVKAHEEALARTLSELFARRRRRLCGCLVVAPWRSDPHVDHAATGAAAIKAAALAGLAYVETPIWGWYRPDWRCRLASVRTHHLPISESALTAKRAALQCFASQLEPLPGGRGAVLPSDFVQAFCGTSEVILP